MAKNRAFSDRRFRDMVNRFDNLAKRFIRHLSPIPGFTQADFLDLVLDPEHRAVLKNAQDIVGPLQRYGDYDVEWPNFGRAAVTALTFGFSPVLKFCLPDYCHNGPRAGAPQEIVDRVEAWVQRRLNIGGQLGIAKETVDLLNRKCSTPEQFRFMLPAVLALIDPEEAALRRALERAKTPGRFPNLPDGARAGIKITQDILAKAMLLPDDVGSEHDVSITVPNPAKVLAPWQVFEGKDYFVSSF